MSDDAGPSALQPAPDHPGWFQWGLVDSGRFCPECVDGLLVRREGERSARLRMVPLRKHSNPHNNVHGGITLALIDMAAFAGAFLVLGDSVRGSVTLELSNQFIGAGTIGEPLDAVAEVLRETRRLVFLRGLVMQGDALIASFTGTLRKASAPR